jgi:hypothetical protein
MKNTFQTYRINRGIHLPFVSVYFKLHNVRLLSLIIFS